VADLNILYNQFGIIFKYKGFEEFNSPIVTSSPSNDFYVINTPPEYYQLVSWAKTSGYHDKFAINVYCFGWAGYFGGIADGIGTVNCGVGSNYITGNPTLVHEIAHCLSIIHTNSSNEHATRDPNNPNFNATYTGDNVVDTNANNGFNDNGSYPYLNLNNCTYTGDEQDNVGQDYTIFHEDVINAMVNSGTCSSSYLTDGQAIRMREALASLSIFNDVVTDVSSLYEPYQGDYYFAGPPNTSNPPLFQPGFDYRFLPCGTGYNVPSDYNDISFTYSTTPVLTISKYETNFNNITHPNHTAIEIDLPLCNGVQKVRKCYDNWNRNASGGKILKFNDDVFNTNVTLMPKDSLSINDQNLINNLPQGLYKIEKNYEDGAVQETVIIKDNN
jgi:hypothetical protein